MLIGLSPRARIPGMATNKEALIALGALIEEANRHLPYYRTPQFGERLKLWTKRASTQLSELGLREEAGRLETAGGNPNVNSTEDYLYATLNKRKAILEAIREDIADHPGFYTNQINLFRECLSRAIKYS